MADHDDDLRALLHDAVADVRPGDGLATVRRRTDRRRARARHWLPVLIGGGAVAATVAVGSVLVGGVGDDPPPAHDAASSGLGPSGATTDDARDHAAGLYFLSGSPTGTRLFREFQQIDGDTDGDVAVRDALRRLTVDRGPQDPDYRTLWPAGSFHAVRVDDDRVIVELGTEAALDAPPGADAGTRRLSVQQAVYTAEAALGEALPVAFEWDGEPAERVLGVPVGPRVQRDRSYAVTAPVNISDPAEGSGVDGVLAARGTMADYVSAVRWHLSDGDTTVRKGAASLIEIDDARAGVTRGAPGWEVDVDLTGLDTGDYTFHVTATDVGQTTDRPARFTDTRTITVR